MVWVVGPFVVADLGLAELASVCTMERDYRTMSTVTTDEYSYVMHIRDTVDHRTMRVSDELSDIRQVISSLHTNSLVGF